MPKDSYYAYIPRRPDPDPLDKYRQLAETHQIPWRPTTLVRLAKKFVDHQDPETARQLLDRAINMMRCNHENRKPYERDGRCTTCDRDLSWRSAEPTPCNEANRRSHGYPIKFNPDPDQKTVFRIEDIKVLSRDVREHPELMYYSVNPLPVPPFDSLADLIGLSTSPEVHLTERPPFRRPFNQNTADDSPIWPPPERKYPDPDLAIPQWCITVLKDDAIPGITIRPSRDPNLEVPSQDRPDIRLLPSGKPSR